MKLLILAASSLILTAPAYAAKVTVDFVSADVDTVSVTFDTEAMMASSGDSSAPYTLSDDLTEVCSSVVGGEEVCVTFATPVPKTSAVGDTVDYTNTLGHSGTATVTAVE